MAIEEKTIGTVTLSNDISIDRNGFKIPFYDERVKSESILTISRELAIKEFHLRGKARGVISYYYGDDEVEHELTFEEIEENVDYRDEFDAFIQELAAERLNLNVFQLQEELREANALVQSYTGELLDLKLELQKYKALAVTENKMVYLPTYSRVKKQAS